MSGEPQLCVLSDCASTNLRLHLLPVSRRADGLSFPRQGGFRAVAGVENFWTTFNRDEIKNKMKKKNRKRKVA